MDFFGEVSRMRDQASVMADRFHLPTVRSLIICYREGASKTYTEILPRPNIDRVNPRMTAQYGSNRTVQVELDDIQVKGISKVYLSSQLSGRGISYVVDGTLAEGVLEGGFEADKVPGMELRDEGGSWSLLLRRRK